jgi:hypothetical protein
VREATALIETGTFVDVDSHGVFGQVSVVDAPARNALAPCPLAEVPQVLAHAVHEHLGTGGQAKRRRAYLGTHNARGELEEVELHLDRTVHERVRLMRAQLGRARQVRLAREDSCGPAVEALHEPLAETRVEPGKVFPAAETHAIRRVRDDESGRGIFRRLGVPQLAHVEHDRIAETRTLHARTRKLDSA